MKRKKNWFIPLSPAEEALCSEILTMATDHASGLVTTVMAELHARLDLPMPQLESTARLLSDLVCDLVISAIVGTVRAEGRVKSDPSAMVH